MCFINRRRRLRPSNRAVKNVKAIVRGATKDDFSGQFFRIFEIIMFCCVVAICDLVHDVETIFHISYVLTVSGNLF